MLIRIIEILFPLFAIVGLGFFVGRRKKPQLAHANALNMDVFVPALVFAALAGKPFQPESDVRLMLATLALVIGSGLAAWALARVTGINGKTLVPPLMFNNSGNLGLPLVVLAFGDAALAPAVVMFMVSNLTHFSFGAWLLDHNARLLTIWKIPSVFATFAGVAVSVSGLEIWPPLLLSIRMLGEISIPLMLFALGVRLTDSRITAIGVGVFGAVARPLIGMAIAGLLLLLFDFPPQERALVLIFGALPPAVLNYMFAERYDQEPDKVASMVLIGNLAAVVFLPIALALVLP